MDEKMKTIEEAAEQVVQSYTNDYGTTYDEDEVEIFKAGVEFAQRWIPVDEELPEPISPPNGIIDNKDLLILKYIKHDSYEFGILMQDSNGVKHWDIPDFGVFEINEVSHWRPIELKYE